MRSVRRSRAGKPRPRALADPPEWHPGGRQPGSTLAELRQAYPDAVQTRTDAPGGSSASFWAVRSGARYIVFQIPEGDTRIATVTVSSTTEPPYDHCS